MGSLILPAIHLSILLGYIFYKTKPAFLEFMRTRHLTVTEGLNKSKKQALDVEAKKKEVDAKLSNFASEKQKIVAEWKEKEGLQTKVIQESSQRLLNQMKIEAEQNKKALVEAVKVDTLKGIGMLVVAQAEAKIRAGLNPEAHRKINEVFTGEVAGVR